jgi:hypothetical protein
MPFKKGQSGNPGGKAKYRKDNVQATIENVTAMAREMSIEALQVLSRIMRDKDAPPGVRRASCSDILNRAWGNPVSYNAEEDLLRRDLDILSDAELQQDIARLRAARDAGGGLAAAPDPKKPH